MGVWLALWVQKEALGRQWTEMGVQNAGSVDFRVVQVVGN